MMHELAKAYDPSAIEQRWAEKWVQEKLFHVETPPPGAPVDESGVFTILLPPPNVTGRLHMGHMLNQTEMDIITRWHRMRGDLALWLPGTDHAGIATQMMVERQLASEGANRLDLGREKFVERVWQWREHYGGAILAQMKRLGASVDWSREYFTMDERLSRAVREVFVRLYEEGLIYRGKYIVNWCPRCMTAISDLEVVHEEVNGKLYEVRYPIVGSDEFITVATTRPETILGDTAIAVNAGDARYKHLHGKRAVVPLMNREVPIILDDIANPEFGTGAVKITPAHDPNDFQAGLRHNLPQLDVMDETAHMNQNAGPYAGLDRYAAREKVLEDLKKQNLLVSVKDHTLSIGKCDRCKTVVEPRLSTQWFVAVNKQPKSGGPSLAGRAADVVRNGEIRVTPENYRTIYLNWMENIYDWCISRQLWWGHRIPAWHCVKCRHIVVAREEPQSCPECGSALEQDRDVLDTWFSSALLPFTAFGWPEQTRDLEVFYPTSLLITGFDILFFWVARMIMMGCHFMAGNPKGSVPFREVYIHALVRDAERQKMSKTKGNVLDPIEVTEKYGTDAVRFTLAAMASPGTDIAFNEARTEGYRAFANKIWNAARFIFMNVERSEAAGVWWLEEFQKKSTAEPGKLEVEATTLEDRWILARFNRVAQSVNKALENHRFDDAANEIYQFFWGEFCDWYIEMVKLRLTAGAQSSAAEKQASRTAYFNLLSIFEASLRLLSPFMPFLTEELWHAIYDGKPPRKSIALAAFPMAESSIPGYEAYDVSDPEVQMAALKEFVIAIRELRAAANLSPKQAVPIEVWPTDLMRQLITSNRDVIQKLAGISEIRDVLGTKDQPRAGFFRNETMFDVSLVYERQIDVAAERERLSKELRKLEAELVNADNQLSNSRFLGKAPAEVVAGLRRRRAEVEKLMEKIREAIDDLMSKK